MPSTRENYQSVIQQAFNTAITIKGNIIQIGNTKSVQEINQKQTADIFSDKWAETSKVTNVGNLHTFQSNWFFDLYGFNDEATFKSYLSNSSVILDAGSGLGFKAAWMAELAPQAVVLAMDISDSVFESAHQYVHIPNLFFIQADIANTGLKENVLDFVLCDQVIMHTENPDDTFAHLSSLLKPQGEFACYVYAKKALPRELVDNYFRSATHDISPAEMWEFSAQVTELGKRLSAIDAEITTPEIPLLGIKAGTYPIQRFIYWNFLKCFWKDDWGEELSRITNFDWYAPSNARRYSKNEFLELIEKNNLDTLYLHEEEACYSGRFRKRDE